MNIYSIILILTAAVIIAVRVRGGYKNGFAKEISVCVSIVIAVAVGRILLDSYEALTSQRISEALYRLIMLGVVFGLYRLIRLVLTALKLFSKLPIINRFDKIFGSLLGIVEGYFIFRFILTLIKGWVN